jgi:acyl carrier protein
MSEESDLRRVVLNIIASIGARVDRFGNLDDDTSLVEAGVLDSMAFLDLVTTLEERTGCILDLAEMNPEEFTSIRGLVQALRSSEIEAAPMRLSSVGKVNYSI